MGIDWDKYLVALKTRRFKHNHQEAIEVLHEFLSRVKHRGYLALSGGKDSTVVAHLLSQIDTSVPVFTQADDMDWPGKAEHARLVAKKLGFTDHEVVWSEHSAADEFGQAISENVETQQLHQTFRHAIRSYTTRRKMRGVILGLRKEESRARLLNVASRGLLYQHQDGEWTALPIANWSSWEVLGYIVKHKLPLFHIYERIGALVGPENVRLCWPVYPKLIPKGNCVVVKMCYPRLWSKLCQRFPELSHTT